MKHLKMLGLFVMAAASLMAFAGSASAAGTFTSPTGTAYTGTVNATLEGSALLEAGFANDTCTSGTVHGTLKTNNEEHASGEITEVAFSVCSLTTDTLNNKGTLTINKFTTVVTGTGVEVTVSAFGTSCVYGLGGTSTILGTAVNTKTVEGSDQVTLLINGEDGKGAKLPKISGGFLCASPARWLASYKVTTPTTSFVE